MNIEESGMVRDGRGSLNREGSIDRAVSGVNLALISMLFRELYRCFSRLSRLINLPLCEPVTVAGRLLNSLPPISGTEFLSVSLLYTRSFIASYTRCRRTYRFY